MYSAVQAAPKDSTIEDGFVTWGWTDNGQKSQQFRNQNKLRAKA
jgi:hypothetical protein